MLKSLTPQYAEFLSPGQIMPEGWLKKQLEIQADGLSGHLEEFWPDVKESGWIGGNSEGWERGPYWLDGIVSLAYLLGHTKLMRRVEYWVHYVMEHQHKDGWLGPKNDKRYGYEYDPWPVFVFLKALTQYAEISGDSKPIEVMSRFFKRLSEVLTMTPLRLWGKYRWGDAILSVFWLYGKTGDERLLNLSQLIYRQRFDWERHFEEFPYLDKTRYRSKEHPNINETALSSHVVNNAMAMKYPALWSRYSGDRWQADLSLKMIETLERYHGQATGMFSGDEHLAGKNPSQGTELCAVVEYMYSLEWLLAITGKAEYADILESVAFNALPATFKPDMWAHQYDQQSNQVTCVFSEDNVYTTNGPDSNLFGLDPNYGCCTANMHQGWPKFASSLWMKTFDGLSAFSYAPCSIHTMHDGAAVDIRVETLYPFDDVVKIHAKTDRKSAMVLRLRQPKWCRSLALHSSDGSVHCQREGMFFLVEADWDNGITLELTIPFDAQWESRYNGSVTLKRGPLVFALKIEEEWRELHTSKPHNELPHALWEVLPASPWNYALKQCDTNDIQFMQKPIGDTPFSPESMPISTSVTAKLVPKWGIEDNAAAAPPPSPLNKLPGEETQITLIPYGCTSLRVTEFPWFEDDSTIEPNS